MEAVQAPIISVVADLINRYPGTISLGQGVVRYGPPPSALERIRSFVPSDTVNKYGPTGGIEPLRDIIAAKLEAENRIPTGADSCIMVTAGSNMAFVHTLFAITRRGDEVILPVPYYFNHEMAITMLDCHAVPVATGDAYLPQPEDIRRAITRRTRAIVTVSPNNPSGMVYSEQCLREINALCAEHGLYHISDEAYEYFTYDGARHFSPGGIPGAGRHTISLYSLSKAYGFAGWRIGYMVAPRHLLEALNKIQDTNLICPPAITQHAALGCLEAGRSYCERQLAGLRDVRRIILDELGRASGEYFSLQPGAGAFYLLLKINSAQDDMTVVERLIREHRVAVIPGHTFGLTHGCYLRLAYAALDAKNAREGINRLTHGLNAVVE